MLIRLISEAGVLAWKKPCAYQMFMVQWKIIHIMPSVEMSAKQDYVFLSCYYSHAG